MSKVEYAKYVDLVLNDYYEVMKILEEADACAQKYAITDKKGKVIHFKGKPGVGERFKNCTLYFKCKGYSDQKAKSMCGLIAAKKCQAGEKYACGVR